MFASIFTLFAGWMTHDTQEQRRRFGSALLFFWLTCAGATLIFLIDHFFPVVNWLWSFGAVEGAPYRSPRSRGFAIAVVPMVVAMCIAIRSSMKAPESAGRKRGAYRDFWKIALFMVGPMGLVIIARHSAPGAVLALVVNGAGLWLAYRWSLQSSLASRA